MTTTACTVQEQVQMIRAMNSTGIMKLGSENSTGTENLSPIATVEQVDGFTISESFESWTPKILNIHPTINQCMSLVRQQIMVERGSGIGGKIQRLTGSIKRLKDISSSSDQVKTLLRIEKVKINEGLRIRPSGAVVDPLWRSARMELGVGFGWCTAK